VGETVSTNYHERGGKTAVPVSALVCLFFPKFTKYPHLAACYKCREYSVNILNCQPSFSCEVSSKNYRGRGKNRRARGGIFFLKKALNIRICPFALNGANV
jgi:hypothetical protein